MTSNLRWKLACLAGAVAASSLVLVSGAPARPPALGSTALPASTLTLVIPAATSSSSCTDRLAGGAGATVLHWTAARTGFVQFHLTGDGRNDWDLGLFDAKTGRRIDASTAFGANEVVQSTVPAGRTLAVKACRLSGSAAVEHLAIRPIAMPLATGPSVKQSTVSIPISSPADVPVLESLGLNLNEAPTRTHATAVLDGPADAAKLVKAGFTYKTVIPDMAAAERGYRAQERSSTRAASTGKAAKKSPLPSGRTTYRHYTDIQAELKALAKRYKSIVRPVTLPVKSFQGRDINGIEVSNHVRARDDGKPTFWLMGEHHAREWPSEEANMEFAYYILQNFGKNSRVTKMLNRARIVITPVINPDGFITSREATDFADNSGDPGGAPSLAESVAPPGGSLAYRRKNCDGASPDPATPCNLQYGVDNNRNYGQNWGGSGAGTDPNDQDYRGPDMWSEPENQAVWHFSQSHDITTLITTHNFASLVLRPPGVAADGKAPDEDQLKKLGDAMARDTGYTSEYGYQLYDTSGTTEDWNYGAAGTFGYTIEMGPGSDQGGNFHISYQRGVIDQWTGAESELGKGKGLRDAYLLAGEAAANRHLFSTLRGTAPPGAVLRVHKNFKTLSGPICTVEDTDVPCTAQGTLPRRSRADHLDYTTEVPGSGRFSWITTPSTRPFVLKAKKTERWHLTCEDPVSHRVLESRNITVDRGQTLVMDLRCSVKRVPMSKACAKGGKIGFTIGRPKTGSFTHLDVYVNGERVKRVTGGQAKAGQVQLSGLKLKNGGYRTVVVGYTSKGRILVGKKAYDRCGAKQGQGE